MAGCIERVDGRVQSAGLVGADVDLQGEGPRDIFGVERCGQIDQVQAVGDGASVGIDWIDVVEKSVQNHVAGVQRRDSFECGQVSERWQTVLAALAIRLGEDGGGQEREVDTPGSDLSPAGLRHTL